MLNRAQLKKYRFNVSKWVAARKAKGLPHDDAARFELHRKAIGRACSSTALTNSELDRVLAALMAEINPDGFDEQMRIQESPDLRRQELQARCWDAVSVFVVGEDIGHSNTKRQRYLDGTASKIFGAFFDKLDERQLQQLMGILERRVRQLERKARAHAIEAGEKSDDRPF